MELEIQNEELMSLSDLDALRLRLALEARRFFAERQFSEWVRQDGPSRYTTRTEEMISDGR